MPTRSDVDDLVGLTQKQLTMIANDFRQPEAVQNAAAAALKTLVAKQLRAAIDNWRSASSSFTDLTQKLVAVTDEARKNPGSDGVAQLVFSIRKLGDYIADVGGFAGHEPPPSAEGDKLGTDTVGPDSIPPPASLGATAAGLSAPPVGTVRASTNLADTADEYLAMYEAASLDPDKQQEVERICDLIAANEAVYHRAGDDLNVPWHFVGIVHSLEAACNFGCHLHNGDPLTHRTIHVPAGRPAQPDPPFAWWTSATDALVSAHLNALHDWSLPPYLWRLEGYNGRGYRRQGRASPYLWSFTDRYVKGKYISDGKFDPNAVSKQCGGVALLKTLIARGKAQI